MERILILAVLWVIGVYVLRHEDKLIAFERRAWSYVKQLFNKRKQKIIVLPAESDEEKQARFDSGTKAGNELYGRS